MSDSETAARIKNSQSKSFRKLNPNLFGAGSATNTGELSNGALYDGESMLGAKPKAKKRIRQSSKPELNKLEAEFQSVLVMANPHILAQSIRFKLSTGMHYTPDFFSFATMTAWEVKGKKAWEDSLVKLRMAAKVWQNITWLLVWKDERGVWQEQHVLP